MIQDMNRPGYKEWYLCIKDVIFGQSNSVPLTTFLQTFFSPVLYCDEILTVCRKKDSTMIQKEKETEKKFYDSVSVRGLQDKLQKSKGSSLNSVNRIIIRHLSDIIKLDDFNIWEEICDECDNAERLKKIKQVPYYKKNLIFRHYHDHWKFYIGFIAVVLENICRIGLITDINQLIESVNNELSKRKTRRLNSYSSDSEFENAAYVVWNLILFMIDSHYTADDGNLFRLRNENRENVRRDLNNYASVLEYYPINTVERFGALKVLAGEGNLYAVQELYFLYLNDTVLYDASGNRKFVLKKNLSEAEILFGKLKNSGEDFFPAFFRHDTHYQRNNFVLCTVRRYKAEYTTYDKDTLIKMMTELIELYINKSMPFNTELLWFIKSVFDEYDFLRKNFETNYRLIQLRLSDNPWIAEIMSSGVNDSGPELHELLFSFYQKDIFKGDDILLSICHAYSQGDAGVLEKYYNLAEAKLRECFDMQRNAVREGIGVENIDISYGLWEMVSSILLKAMREELKKNP